MASKTGPEMFAGLTDDESWVLRMKLSSGAAQASRVIRDYDLSGEIHAAARDLHAAWETYLSSNP